MFHRFEIAEWLQTSCSIVPGYGSGQPIRTPQRQDGPDQDGGSALYQCGGSLVPYTGGQAGSDMNPPQGGTAGADRRPPPEAIEACADLAEGEACTVNLRNGGMVDGSCRSEQGQLVCVPDGNRPPANQ